MSRLEQVAQEQRKEANKGIDKLVELSKKKKTIDSQFKSAFISIARWLPFISIQIFGFAVIGLDKFVKGEWNWDYLLSPEFWNRFINYQLALWIIGISWFINIIIKLKNSHEVYLDNLYSIKKQVDYDHNESEFIEKQVEIERIIRKKYFIEQNVYRKLYKLRIKYNIVSIEEFLDKDGIERHLSNKNRFIAKITLLKPRLHIVKRKMERLVERLTFDWQKEYIKHFVVRYPKISRSLLVGGIKASEKNERFNDYKLNLLTTSVSNIAPTSLVTTTIGFILLAFSFTFEEVGIAEILMFAIQTLLILWNTFMLITLAPTIFETTYLNVSEQRRSDITKLRNRHDNNNQNEKEIIQILEYDRKE